MLALLSVWLGVAALLLSLVMAVWRRTFTDVWLAVALYTAIFSLTFAGMTLWSLRREPRELPAVAARRAQSRVGIGLSLTAIAVVYGLVHRLANPAG
ncbi:MAG: hypothetical protein AMXMBFR13_39890 [Phycisphaerae bacterium]